MGKLVDLSGQIINDWKVIKRAPTRNRDTYWLCECQKCGKAQELLGRSLKQNKVTPHCLVCPICGTVFSLVERKNQGNRKYCYNCVPKTQDQTHKSTYYINRALKHQIVLYKGGKCEKCGYDKCEQALHFHHLNPDIKDFQISESYNLYGCNLEKMKEEADKCIMICANCHAEIHAND